MAGDWGGTRQKVPRSNLPTCAKLGRSGGDVDESKKQRHGQVMNTHEKLSIVTAVGSGTRAPTRAQPVRARNAANILPSL